MRRLYGDSAYFIVTFAMFCVVALYSALTKLNYIHISGEKINASVSAYVAWLRK